MNIYLILNRLRWDRVPKDLSIHGNVIVIDSLNDLPKSDTEDVILGIDPSVTDWKLPTEILDQFKKLKGICTLSAWAYYIDIEYCKKREIIVCNTPEANSQSVAENAIWMMFSLARKLPLQIQDNFKTKIDSDHLQTEISGKTMAVFGLGNIGKRIAKMGKGLGMKVIYWSPNSKSNDYEYMEFDEAMRSADYIFNCVEALKETRNLFGEEKLALAKSGAYFISVMGGMGWGPEDDDYLVKSVNNGKLAGFAIENEHEPNFRMPQVVNNANLFMPGGYAYYTHEAESLSWQKWIQTITGIATKNYKHRVV